MFRQSSPIEVKVHDHCGTILLNRPDRRNALSRAMLEALKEAVLDLRQEKKVRAMILTGAGSAFCAGMDLEEMQQTASLPNALEQWGEDAEAFRSVVQTMLETTKPILAAVNGPAVAGGGGLVLACDIVIASENARIGFPEPRRGIVAGIVAPLLAYRIGAGRAARMLFASSLFDAQEAEKFGMFHEVVANDQPWARAVEVAAEIALGAPEAVQLTKRLLTETIGEHLMAQLAAGAAASATARTTEAAAEGLSAYLEKREPKWK